MAAVTYPNYPTTGDVATFLMGFNVLKSITLSTAQQTIIQNYLAARIQNWERTSGYMPFLCAQDSQGNPVQTTRIFNPPGNLNSPTPTGGYYWFSAGAVGRSNRLYVECGFTAISQIMVNVTFNYAGDSLTYLQDYLLLPNNSIVEGKPYNEVQFLWNMIGGIDQSITITGNFGYGTTVPADAWQAIIQGTAADLMGQIALLQLGDAIEIEEKDEKVTLRTGKGVSAYSELADTWNRSFMRTMSMGGYVREILA